MWFYCFWLPCAMWYFQNPLNFIFREFRKVPFGWWTWNEKWKWFSWGWNSWTNTAASIWCRLNSHNLTRTLNLPLTRDVLGIVATLASVNDDRLSRLVKSDDIFDYVILIFSPFFFISNTLRNVFGWPGFKLLQLICYMMAILYPLLFEI